MKECSNCKLEDVCETKGKVCVYYTPNYCNSGNCDECKYQQECDRG